jgi:hypothetical protein
MKLLILLLLLAGCFFPKLPRVQTSWVVVGIQPSKYTNILYYRLEPTVPTGLAVHNTWIADSIGKFTFGDTLCMTLTKSGTNEHKN